MKAVPYYRVSTERQGRSGLGLEAQQKAVRDYASFNDIVLLDEFIEVESGKNNKRPVLHQALELCKQQKSMLLIAKLDRLARNVLFISTLQASSVQFRAVDNPHAGKFMVHIMAAFAEHEREQISQRTIAALAAAKIRGVQLGKHGREVLSQQNKKAADEFALVMQPAIHDLQIQGFRTIRSITEELNHRKVPTFRGGSSRWYVSTVHQILKRLPSAPLHGGVHGDQ